MKEIPLSGKNGVGKVILVDDEDYEWLSQYKWNLIDFRKHKNPCNYHHVAGWIKGQSGQGRHSTIHQLIMGRAPKGFVIDHIDRDTLNNQRNNLRFVSNSVSAHNRNLKGKSKFRGVSWHKRTQKWRSDINFNSSKYCSLGTFIDEIEAAKNYDYYALMIYGDGAAVNFPDFDYATFIPKRTAEQVLKSQEIKTSLSPS